MRALVITYYFPPAGGGGVQRVLSWCKHLPKHGINVTVVAPEQPQWLDQDPTLVVPTSTEIIRTPDLSAPPVLPAWEAHRSRGLFTRILSWLRNQPRRFMVPDIHRKWIRPTIDEILSGDHGPFDVVISTSPPESSHVVAAAVAQRLGIPWIADFRDSWLDLPHLRRDRLSVRIKAQLNKRIAVRIMRHASAAVTVSQPLADDLELRHPHLDVHVVSNGTDIDAVERATQRANGFYQPEKFVLTYTGNFFGRQHATTLLRGIEHFLTTNPDAQGSLLARFIGSMKPSDIDLITTSDLISQHVECIDFMRHDDVLAQQLSSDVLLLFVANGAGSAGVVTGKVFEYIAAQRPIIAAVPASNSAAKLVRDTDSGVIVDPDDASAIADAIAAEWHKWQSRQASSLSRQPLTESVRLQIDRAERASDLVAVIHSVT